MRRGASQECSPGACEGVRGLGLEAVGPSLALGSSEATREGDSPTTREMIKRWLRCTRGRRGVDGTSGGVLDSSSAPCTRSVGSGRRPSLSSPSHPSSPTLASTLPDLQRHALVYTHDEGIDGGLGPLFLRRGAWLSNPPSVHGSTLSSLWSPFWGVSLHSNRGREVTVAPSSGPSFALERAVAAPGCRWPL